MLTRKQQELLVLIQDRIGKDGVPPSFDEMKDALGLASKSGIHRLIGALEERGFIRRLPHRARALEVVKLPDAVVKSSAVVPSMPLYTAANTDLPLYGRIAAGTAIEAIRDQGTTMSVPSSLLVNTRGTIRPEDYYVLEIAGDSMIEAGILDGDHVVIRRADHAEVGSIVVALIDGQEVTLKRWRPKAGRITLEPANSAYTPMVFDPARVRVQGRLAGLMRRY